MKAIKINVENQKVYEVDHKQGIQDIYEHIGNGCTIFCVPIVLDNSDSFYLDDEALMHPDSIKGGFIYNGYPFCGNALVVGTDMVGEDIAVLSSVEEVKSLIRFISKEEMFHLLDNF